MERMLYRLSLSEWRDQFLLKGALLFSVWNEEPHRPTRDADFLGFMEQEISEITDIFRTLCCMAVDDDGVYFEPASVIMEEIRESHAYDGLRVRLAGNLDKANISLQIDIGFGDIVTPAPEEVELPVLLDQSPPKLKAYPVYTVIAEKLEAIVKLGVVNSRMKDFYDLWVLVSRFDLDQRIVANAIRATFRRRKTEIPVETPVAFTREFYGDAARQRQWAAFLARNDLANSPNLDIVANKLEEYFRPLLAG